MAAPVEQRTDGDRAWLSSPDLEDERFARLYARYRSILINYARKQGADDPSGVADLALFDGFRAMDRLHNQSEGALNIYLHRAALGHTLRDHYRSNPIPTAIDEDAVVAEDSIDAWVDRAWLRELVGELPIDQRQVIEARFFEGLTGRETGQKLGKDPNAVYQLQHRAIRGLRRLIFTAVFLVLAVVAIAVARQTLGQSATVDSSPIDRSGAEDRDVDVPRPSTTLRPDEPRQPERDDRAALEVPVTAPSIADRQQVVAGIEEPASTQPPVAGPGDTASTVRSTTTTPPSSTATTPLPQVVPAATAMNACAPQMINPTTINVKLYYPASNRDRVAEFNWPSAVRFVDRQGQVLHTVDTSGPMTTGIAVDSHGWISSPGASGTHAHFDDATPARYWGVLAAFNEVTGWAQIQTLEPATNNWITNPSC